MKNNNIFALIAYFILIPTAFVVLFPFLFMTGLSLISDTGTLPTIKDVFWGNFTFDNYKKVFSDGTLLRCFFNSFFVAAVTTVFQVIISAAAGYAFARLNFKFKKFLFVLIILSMMVPPQVNIIPLFFVMRTFSLTNTFAALILPGLVGGFGVFMMKQFFSTLPKDLENAAKIDGCGMFGTFFKIMLPLAKPAVASLAIFTFITSWNSFMWPLIVTDSVSVRTLPVQLAHLKASYREIILWGEISAYCVICCIPVLVAFLAGRKHFTENISTGAVKE